MENTALTDTGEEALDEIDEDDEDDEGSVFSDLDDDIDVEAAHEVLNTSYEVVVEAAEPQSKTPPDIPDGQGEGDALSGEPEAGSSLLSDSDLLVESDAKPKTSTAEMEPEKNTPSRAADVQAKATPPQDTSPSKPNLGSTPSSNAPPRASQASDLTMDDVVLDLSDDALINPEIPLPSQPVVVEASPTSNQPASPISNQPAAVWEDGKVPASSFPSGGTGGMGGIGDGGDMSNVASGEGQTGPSKTPPSSTWEEGMEGLLPEQDNRTNSPDDLDVQMGAGLEALEEFSLEGEIPGDEGVDLETPLAFGADEPADNVVDLEPYLVATASSPAEASQDKTQLGRLASTSPQATSSAFDETLEQRVPAPPPPPHEELDALTRQMLLTTPQRVVVELGALELKGEEIMELGYGSVLRLNRRVGQMVDITLNGWRLAKGEVVLINERDLGVRMVSVYSNPPKQSP